MQLQPRAMAITIGLLAGGMMLTVSLINRVSPGYGLALLELAGSLYPGYHAGTGLRDVLLGTLYALVDGAIAGWLLAWLYNRFAA